MTDRKQALADLLEKVEVGDTTGSLKGTPLKGFGDDYHRAIHGSLDAAKALHEKVLPGWYAQIHSNGPAEVGNQKLKVQEKSWAVRGNPARAWLIVILKALIAEEN